MTMLQMETNMTQKARKLTTLSCAAVLASGFAGSAMAQTVDVSASAGVTTNVGATVGVSASAGTATGGVTGVVSGLLGDVTGLLGGLGLGGIL